MDHLYTPPPIFDPLFNDINVDMDGVVADFDAFVHINMGRTFSHKAGPGADKEMWEFLSKYERLYYILPTTPYAEELLQAVMSTPARYRRMLTAIPRRASIPTAEVDKIKWMAERFPHIEIPVTIGPYSRDKWKHCNPGDILIDDREDNIEEWIAAGGIGILHDTNNVQPTLDALKKYTGNVDGRISKAQRTQLIELIELFADAKANHYYKADQGSRRMAEESLAELNKADATLHQFINELASVRIL